MITKWRARESGGGSRDIGYEAPPEAETFLLTDT